MRIRALGLSVLAIALAYAASPYITLYRLDRALRTGDAGYIDSHVDWSALREGVAMQVEQSITGQAGKSASDSNDLPAFGSGFARTMATHLVDKAMAREAIIARIRLYAQEAAIPSSGNTPVEPQMDRTVGWACFDGAISFGVELSVGPTATGQPVHMEMRMSRGIWRVVYADIPPAVLMQTASRT